MVFILNEYLNFQIPNFQISDNEHSRLLLLEQPHSRKLQEFSICFGAMDCRQRKHADIWRCYRRLNDFGLRRCFSLRRQNNRDNTSIPQAVIKMNRQNSLCTELISVETMSDRKATMKELADVFVVLPGSYGTLDEMFDVIAAAIVGEHKKQLIVVNENGFYDDLMRQIDRMIDEKFIPVVNYKPLIVSNISDCILHLKNF